MKKLLNRLQKLQAKRNYDCQSLAKAVGKSVVVLDNGPDYYTIVGRIDDTRHLVVINRDHEVSSYPTGGGGWRGGKTADAVYRQGELLIVKFGTPDRVGTYAKFELR